MLIPGAFERRVSTPSRASMAAEASAPIPSPAVSPEPVCVIAAPPQATTWIGKAASALGDLTLAVLVVAMVPLLLMAALGAVGWLVRAAMAFAGRP